MKRKWPLILLAILLCSLLLFFALQGLLEDIRMTQMHEYLKKLHPEQYGMYISNPVETIYTRDPGLFPPTKAYTFYIFNEDQCCASITIAYSGFMTFGNTIQTGECEEFDMVTDACSKGEAVARYACLPGSFLCTQDNILLISGYTDPGFDPDTALSRFISQEIGFTNIVLTKTAEFS